MIAGNQMLYTTGKGNFEKWFVIGIRQRLGKRGRGHCLTAVLNVLKECGHLVFLKTKLVAM